MIELSDRWITNSGITVVDPSSPLIKKLLKQKNFNFRVTEVDNEIERFNQFSHTTISTPVDADFAVAPISTTLPAYYQDIDIDETVAKKLTADCATRPKPDAKTRHVRAMDELDWFYRKGKYDLLRTLLYIVDTLTAHNVPWGTGRGSSVNSYILFLIGVHDIDPIEYNLDWKEFMRD